MRSYTLIRRLEGHQSSVVSCDFSPDSALLVTASYDSCVIMWDPYTGEQLRTLRYGPGRGHSSATEGFGAGCGFPFSLGTASTTPLLPEAGWGSGLPSLALPVPAGEGAGGSQGLTLGCCPHPQPRPVALHAGFQQ